MTISAIFQDSSKASLLVGVGSGVVTALVSSFVSAALACRPHMDGECWFYIGFPIGIAVGIGVGFIAGLLAAFIVFYKTTRSEESKALVIQ